MSDRPPPPPGFWQPPPPPTSSNSTYAGQHPLPPPPPQTVSTVPPPLYGYNPSSHYSSFQSHNNAHHRDTTTKRRRIDDTTCQWNCSTCNVSLDSEEALQAHVASHVKCSKCNFQASQKVVNGHFGAVHGKYSGGGFKTVTIAIPGCRVQRFNICVGNHPQDVQKWISDRKRKFPRQAAANKPTENKKETALGSLLDGYGSSSSEEDDNDNTNEKPAAHQRVSSESTTTTRPTNESNTDATQQWPTNYRTKPCKYFLRNGSCRNGDACNFSHDIQQRQQRSNTQKSKRQRQRGRSSTSTTLLRELLQNDARREATLSIQLLEYIADCNYLQKQRSGGRDCEDA